MLGFYRDIPALPPGLRIPPAGVYVCSWTPLRNGWMYCDWTEQWYCKSLGYCIRQFRQEKPYVGTVRAVLCRDGKIWAYKHLHTTRWQTSGAVSGGRWVKVLVQTTGCVLRRTSLLRWIGIQWRIT